MFCSIERGEDFVGKTKVVSILLDFVPTLFGEDVQFDQYFSDGLESTKQKIYTKKDMKDRPKDDNI